MNELTYLTASQLAVAIRQGHVSSEEVVDAYLARLAQRNPALNAIVTLDEERTRALANEADKRRVRGELLGPLHGVPVTIKDTLSTAGMRTTAGYPPLAQYIPKTDATAVARIKAAGA